MQVNEKVTAMREYVETALNTMFAENVEAHAANPARIERLAGLANLRRMLDEETPEDFVDLLAAMVELNVHSGAGYEYKKAYQHYLSLEV